MRAEPTGVDVQAGSMVIQLTPALIGRCWCVGCEWDSGVDRNHAIDLNSSTATFRDTPHSDWVTDASLASLQPIRIQGWSKL